ncbi:hypothetical protein ABH931_000588 [Streptacidiphilus sp. MAP12-33]|uniref:hypothetical protein n=1 Tax=Streptacidiphilus sp. MAP12-33 TaxID=3156266 RepID=UPI003515770E
MTAALTGQIVKAVLKVAARDTQATEFRAAARQLMAADSLPPAIGRGPASTLATAVRSGAETAPLPGQPDSNLRNSQETGKR